VKKVWMISSVAMVAGGLILSAGCGTTRPPAQDTAAPVVMPPTTPVSEVVVPKVEEVKAPVVAEVTTKTYVVKSGDSISHIANRFKVPAKDILKLNNITNPNKIRVGQKLLLPGTVDLGAAAPAKTGHKKTTKTAKTGKSAKTTKTAKTTKAAGKAGSMAAPADGAPAAVPAVEGAAPVAPAAELAPAPKSNEVLHVVEANQDLSSIAMMYGVRAEEVIKLNNLSSPDVKVGQTLKIPPPAE
jgi:N-acetylmuramoyl-L-alanine amidase